MRPFGELMDREEALRRLLQAVAPVTGVERVPLDAAAGRVLAEPVASPIDVPAFTRATMDGFAVRAEDVQAATAEAPVALRVVAAAHAGEPATRPVEPGTCVRIATGAPLPAGADAVQRVEDTEGDGDEVRVLAPVRQGQFLQGRGHDIAQGTRVLEAGVVLTPERVGLLASVGLAEAPVRARPRVALLPSGTEVTPPGEPLREGAIYDANGVTVAAELARHGAVVQRLPPVEDRADALEKALLEAAAGADFVVVTGGSSVGDRDLLADLAAKHGDVLVHGVRVKPGKPVLVATLDAGALLVGLPGNPTSCLVTARLFLAPAVREAAGLPRAAPRVERALLGGAIAANRERDQVIPVCLTDDRRAVSTFKGSGALTSLADADGWVLVPRGVELEEGTLVEVHAW